jgi:hypothetical protein
LVQTSADDFDRVTRGFAPTTRGRTPSESTPRPLLFDHMPRCGGTSFTTWLRAQYATDRTLALEGRGNAERVAAFAALSESARFAIELVVGHASRDVLHLVRPDMLRITCFRDPVARVHSFYRYVRAEPAHIHHDFVMREELSLAAFARDPRIPGAQNYFTYQLSRLPREEIARDPKSAVEAALAFLAREFDLVGSLARLDVFAAEVAEAARFAGDRAQEKSTQEKSTQEKSTQEKHPGGESLVTRALRWLRAETGDPSTDTPPPQPAIAHLNATDGTRGAPLDAETLAAICAANEADLAFFQRIESLAGSRLAGGRCRVV